MPCLLASWGFGLVDKEIETFPTSSLTLPARWDALHFVSRLTSHVLLLHWVLHGYGSLS